MGLASHAVCAVPSAVAFTPADLSPAFWYDASNSGSITLNGSNVSQWNDLSGNSRHLTQGTAASQPAYVSAGQNGLNIVTFDGVDDALSRATTPALSQPFSIWMAMKFTTVTAGYRPISSGSTVQVLLSGSNLQLFAGTSATAAGTESTTAVVYGMVFNGSTSILRRNGVADANSGSLAVSTGSIAGLSLASRGGTAFFSALSVFEVVGVAGQISAGSMTSLEAYLKAKWGTP